MNADNTPISKSGLIGVHRRSSAADSFFGMPQRIQVRLTGIVQGVGFRPFVYKLAQRLKLAGYVLNDSSGLIAEVEGPEAADRSFPGGAGERASSAGLDSGSRGDFPAPQRRPRIPHTAERGGDGQVRADLSGHRDVRASAWRISPIRAIGATGTRSPTAPTAARATRSSATFLTTGRTPPWRAFAMCAECRAEYDDPANRRFHAQPNACPVCGPALSAEIAEAQRRLADGEILAIKGLGGFHLACDARNAAAVARLRARKRRSDKPFAVMVRDLAAARELCVVDEAAARALSGPRHADRDSAAARRTRDCRRGSLRAIRRWA